MAEITDFKIKNGLVVSTTATIEGTTQSTSTTTGALVVKGGVGVGGNLYVAGEISASKLIVEYTTVTTSLIQTDDIIQTSNTTPAISTETGALIIAGGAGIGGNLYVGGSVVGTATKALDADTATTATYANNLNGGQLGSLVYQNSNSQTEFLSIASTSGWLLFSNGTTPYWSAADDLLVNNAGTAEQANKWTTAVNITLSGDLTGIVSIDGSVNVTLTATIQPNSVELGTDTTGNYVASGQTSGFGISGSTSSESGVFAISINSTSSNTTSTIVYRDDLGNFSAGVITANLTGVATTATNIENGSAGQLVYQISTGTTGFVSTGSQGDVLVSKGSSAPLYQNTLTLSGSVDSTSTLTGTLQVVGGVGIGKNIVVGEKITGLKSTGEMLSLGNSSVGDDHWMTINSLYGSLEIGRNTNTNAYIKSNMAVGTFDISHNSTKIQINSSDQVLIPQATISTSTQTGAFVVTGGVGIGDDLWVGGNHTVNGTFTANGPAIFQNTVVFNGTSTYVYSSSTVLTDNIINLHVPVGGTPETSEWTVDDGKNIGHIYHYYDGADRNAALVLSASSKYLEWFSNGVESYSIFTGTTYGTFKTGSIKLVDTTTSISTTTGALTITGGVGIGGNLWVGGTINGTFNGNVSGITTTATNLAGGTTGSVPYQTNIGQTTFLSIGSTGTVMVSTGSSPIWQNTLTLSGTTSATNTTSGALQVVGGVGIGGNLYVGGTINGTVTTATNIAGGLDGQLVYQLSSGQTSFVSTATSGTVLVSRGTLSPVYQNTLTLAGTTAATSTTTGALVVAGGLGVGGDIHFGGNLYQNGVLFTGGGGGLISPYSGIFTMTNTTTSVSTVTGALQVAGGAGIGGDVYLGNSLNFTKSSASMKTYVELTEDGISSLVFEGTQGKLLSIDDTFTGTIFAVAGQSGIPNIEVLDTGRIKLAEFGNYIEILSTTASNSTSTGALVVAGGVGIAGNLYVGGTIVGNIGTVGSAGTATNLAGGTTGSVPYQQSTGSTTFLSIGSTGTVMVSTGTAPVWQNTLTLAGTTNSTSTTTGALQVRGGVGIGGDTWIGGYVEVLSTAQATSTVTGALQVIGGVGVGGNLYVGGEIVADKLTIQYTTVTTTLIQTDDVIRTLNTSSSTSTLTGALVVGGGAGIGGNLYVGGTINGTVNGTVTTATNLAGGAAGSVPYQSTTGSTTFVSIATTSGWILTSNGTAPIWNSPQSLSVSVADITGGTAGQLLYQIDTSDTGFVSTGTSGTVLVSRGTLSPVYQNTLTLAGTTSATSTTTGALQVVGGMGVGGDVYLGNALNFVKSSASMKTYVELTEEGISSLVFEGSQGKLLSIDDTFTGTIFAVAGQDGIPSIEVLDTGAIILGEFSSTSISVTVKSSVNSFSTSTGALTVLGGVGIAGNLYVGGTINGTIAGAGTANTASTILTTATISTASHFLTFVDSNNASAAGETVYTTSSVRVVPSTGEIDILSTLSSTSTLTGALVVSGGVGVGGNLYVGGTINGTASSALAVNTIVSSSSTAHFLTFVDSNNTTTTAESVYTTSSVKITPSTGRLEVLSTASSTSTTTGALVVSGGVGIAGNLYIGGEIVAEKLTIQYTTVTTTLIQTDDVIRTSNTSSSTSTLTGALVIAGGAGIGGNLWVGGTINGTFNGAVSGTATTATNLAGGAAGSIPYQSSTGTTTFLPIATTSGWILSSTGSIPVWTTSSGGSAITLNNDVSSTTTHFLAFVSTSTGTVSVLKTAANTGMVYIPSTGNFGVGTTSAPVYKLEVNGSFAATTKSFFIDHPTKPGMKLRYGSLEGPENGVYVRGRLTNNNIIDLPEYWTGLVDQDSITVSLTAIGQPQQLWVKSIENNQVIIESNSSIDCFYTVFAERKDVDKLEVEIF